MKQVLTIALCALMLSGCVANWSSNRTGPRWRDGPADSGGTSGQDGSVMAPSAGPMAPGP